MVIDIIDIVFTYVDFNDVKWINKKNKDMLECNKVVVNNNHYNSNLNEIKYAVRSIEKYFKNNYRHIYFVTNNGKLPSCFSENHNLIPIHYETLVGTTSYNSNTIESHLHKIPGLSEYYLYFNDDTIINKKLYMQDLITIDDKLIWYSESNIFVNIVNQYPIVGEIIDLKDGGCNISRQKIYKLLKLDKIPTPISHSPKMFKKSLVERFCNKFSRQINDQVHRKFRSSDDFCFIFAFCFYYEKKKLLDYRNNFKTKILIQFDNETISKIVNGNNFINYTLDDNIDDSNFICVEDYRKDNNIDIYCKQILDDMFPLSCKYEKKNNIRKQNSYKIMIH